MKSEKLYYSDPYLKEVEAEVIEVKENGIILDKTIFYPEGGGQRGDKGYWGSYFIKDTQKLDGSVLHIIDGEKPKVGEKAMLKLDWPNRFAGMVEHTAQHLISSILFSSFSIGTVAVHQGDGIITIETDRSSISHDTLLSVEEKAIGYINENRRVWQEDMPREKALGLHMRRTIKVDDKTVKVVFIDGLDAVACGGVHLSSLGQIGEIAYLYSETIRGHERTYWVVGEKCREKRRSEGSIIEEAKKLLSSSEDSLILSLEKLIEENKNLRRELNRYKAESALKELEKNVNSGNYVYSTDYDLDPIIERACSLNKKLFILKKGDKKTFLFVGKKEDFNALKEKISLKGGGREPLFRGTLECDESHALGEARELLL